MHLDEKLTSLVEPVTNELGLVLWGIEMSSQGNRNTLRIYIDSENGVDVSDCESVSRQLSSLFDVEDPISGNYVLEVSSPGLDRPLFKAEQYSQYVGERVKIKLHRAFEGRRNFKGVLKAVENDEASVVVDEHEYILPIESIEKANILPRY